MDENQGKGIRVLGIAFSSARYCLPCTIPHLVFNIFFTSMVQIANYCTILSMAETTLCSVP